MFQFEYNKALPATIKTFTIPKGYAIIDLEPQSPVPSLARFQATVTARDVSGDVVLKLRLTPQPGSLLAIAPEFPKLITIEEVKVTGTDEKGRHYLTADKPAIKLLRALSGGSSDSLAVQLVPREPLTDGTPPPKQMTLNITVAFRVGSGLIDAANHALTKTISLPLMLPRRGHRTFIDRFRSERCAQGKILCRSVDSAKNDNRAIRRQRVGSEDRRIAAYAKKRHAGNDDTGRARVAGERSSTHRVLVQASRGGSESHGSKGAREDLRVACVACGAPYSNAVAIGLRFCRRKYPATGRNAPGARCFS